MVSRHSSCRRSNRCFLERLRNVSRSPHQLPVVCDQDVVPIPVVVLDSALHECSHQGPGISPSVIEPQNFLTICSSPRMQRPEQFSRSQLPPYESSFIRVCFERERQGGWVQEIEIGT